MDNQKIIDAVEKGYGVANSELDSEIFSLLNARNFGISDDSISEDAKRSITKLVSSSLEASKIMLAVALADLFPEN